MNISKALQSEERRNWVSTYTAGWWVDVWEGAHKSPFKSTLKIHQYFYKQQFFIIKFVSSKSVVNLPLEVCLLLARNKMSQLPKVLRNLILHPWPGGFLFDSRQTTLRLPCGNRMRCRDPVLSWFVLVNTSLRWSRNVSKQG